MDQSQRAVTPRPFLASQFSPLWLSWLLVVAVVLAIWAPVLADNFRDLANPPASAAPALHSANVTANGNATYHVALDLVFGMTSITVAALILRRHRTDSLAASAAFVLTIWGPLNGVVSEAAGVGPWWARISALAAWGAWFWLIARSVRLYRTRPPLLQRQQIRWLLYGATIGLGLILIVAVSIGSALTLSAESIDRHMTGHLLLVIGGAAFPIGLGAAWLRPTVPDPDTLIRRTLVYGALAAIMVGLTVCLVLAPSLLYYELGPVYFLGVVAAWAVISLPLQQFLQREINRLLYGQRDEPIAVLNSLGDRLELGSPETMLATIVETVATTLKLPMVTIQEAGSNEVLASIGRSELEPVSLAIVHQSEEVGRLIVSPRARDEPLHERDHEILRLIARQAAPTVRAVLLTQDLRRSRQQILTGREEERRRIRQDLHDGLGPSLAAIAMQADTARAILDENPAGAREILAAVTEQAEEVVQEVRRLVYDLRPPALDELGLTGAIARLARQGASSTLRIEVNGPEALPSLDAAVEVAAYRIVAEALTNVVRHANARTCEVRVATTTMAGRGELHLTVDDDGRGIDPAATVGIGLHSMRDRASEVGGSATVAPRPEGGTRVFVTLPLREPDGDPAPGRVRPS
ncbi:MAG: sensor histidine kinase [bacterium]